MDWKQILPAAILAVFAVTLGIMLTGYFTLPELSNCTVYCNSSSCVSSEAANESAVICLNQDIIGGVNISANNVTINCQNYKIDANDAAYGIFSVGFNESTIANCEIINASFLIYVQDSYGLNIFNNILHDSSYYVDNTGAQNEFGMDLSNVNNSSIINNTIYNIRGVKSSGGLAVDLSNNLVIESNVISNVINGEGLFMSVANSNISVISNEIYNITGLYAYGAVIYANDSNISFNKIYDNPNGLGIYQSINATLEENEIYNCAEFDWGVGVEIWQTQDITLRNNNITENNFGMFLDTANNTKIYNSNISNNADTGVYLTNSQDTLLQDIELSSNGIDDFVSESESFGTIGKNITINNSIISFEAKDVNILGTTAPADDLAGYANLSRYLDITDNSADSWIFLNISYDELDIPDYVSEDSLILLKYNGTDWVVPGSWATPNEVDKTNNYVYANITNFSSIFAPMGVIVCDCENETDCEDKLADTINCPSGIGLTQDVTNPDGLNSGDLNYSIIDCNGFAFIGNGTMPFYEGTANNLIIQNCIIKNYTTGLLLSDSHDNLFLNNTFEDVLTPIRTDDSSYNEIILNCMNLNWFGGDGIWLSNSTNNLLERNTILDGPSHGIVIHTDSNNNTILNNTINNTLAHGIFVYNSSYNDFINNTVNNNSDRAFVSYETSSENNIINLLADGIQLSFNYGGEILIKTTASPESPPNGYSDLSKFIDIENFTTAWVTMNISYTAQDISENDIVASTLRMWKHNGPWHEIAGSSVDTTNRVVSSGNITDFSVFAPIGKIKVETTSTGFGSTPTRLEFQCVGSRADYYFNILPAFESNIPEDAFCNDLRLAEIETNKEVLGTEIRIKETEFEQPVPETLYKYFEIYSTEVNKENIEKAVLELRISNEWISENRIDVSSIELYKYAGEWLALDAKQTDSDTKYYYFTAETDEFSVFAASGKTTEADIDDPFWIAFETIQKYYLGESTFDEVIDAIGMVYKDRQDV